MGKGIQNLLGLNRAPANFMDELLVGLRPYLLTFFAAVAAVGVGYGIYLAILLSKAEDPNKRKAATKRIVMALSGLMIIVILTGYLITYDVGEVFDQDAKAMRKPQNYALAQSVFPFDKDDSNNNTFNLYLEFRGQNINAFYWTVVYSGPTTTSGKAASIAWNEDRGWVFIYPWADPPDPVDIFNFTGTVTFQGPEGPETVTVRLAVQVYDPLKQAPPTEMRPEGLKNMDPPLTTWVGPGGTPGGPGGTPGGTGVPSPPIGIFGFVAPVELPTGKSLHDIMGSGFANGSSASNPQRCQCAQCLRSPRGDAWLPHRGQDIAASGLGRWGDINIEIFPMAAGIVVNAYRGASGVYGESSGYGNFIVIRHDDTIMWNGVEHVVYSLYAHMVGGTVMAATNGTTPVTTSTILGRMGSTGSSTGIHLHWEVGLIPVTASNAMSLTYTSQATRVCPCCLY